MRIAPRPAATDVVESLGGLVACRSLNQRIQQGGGRRHLVRPRRDPAPRLLRRHLDQLDVGTEKVKEGETTNDLFAFLTTEPNAEVGAIHPKAMPVILMTDEERDV